MLPCFSNFGYNELSVLDGQLFQSMSKLQDLTLSHNRIERIPDDAFTGLTSLQYL